MKKTKQKAIFKTLTKLSIEDDRINTRVFVQRLNNIKTPKTFLETTRGDVFI